MQTQLQTNLNQLHVVQVTFDTFLLSETKTDGIFIDGQLNYVTIRYFKKIEQI